MATGRPILIDRAGPSGLPAAVLHPDDPLPKTWRVASEWSYRGQRGAWLAYTAQPGSFRHKSDAALAQVVYRTTAKHSPRTSTTGQGIAYAARGLVCSVSWHMRHAAGLNYWPPKGLQAQDDADKQARLNHLGMDSTEAIKHDNAALDLFLGARAPKGRPSERSEADQTSARWPQVIDALERRARDEGLDAAMDAFDWACETEPLGMLWRPSIKRTLQRRLGREPADSLPIPQVFLDAFAE